MFSLQIPETQRIIDIKAILNNSLPFPIISFGTFKITGRDTIFKVLDVALRVGYRSIDTAAVYGNEEDIGLALKKLLPKYNLNRKDIFITSKLAPYDHGDEITVTNAVYKSLRNLDTPYLDLYLIHWPGKSNLSSSEPANSKYRAATWETLIKLYNEGNGILKSIGVSNYTYKHLYQLIQNSSVIPAVNQIEIHPHWLPPVELKKLCADYKILCQAYSPFGGTSNENLLKDPIVNNIARKNNLSPAQILILWALQKGYAVVPKSVTPEHIEKNADLSKILSEEDMNVLNNFKYQRKYLWNPDVVQ